MKPFSHCLALTILLFVGQAQAAEPGGDNQVSLSATVHQDVESDIFQAVLSLTQETSGDDLGELYDKINTQANKAYAVARKYSGMDAVTRANTTSAIYKKGRIEGWRVRYVIALSTQRQPDLAKLVGELQSFMKLDNMEFKVSDETRKKTQDALIERGIGEFNARATLITRAQKMRSYKLKKMNVNAGHQPISPYRATREVSFMSSKSATPPPVKAGKEKITVSISGTIELQN